MQQKSKCQHKKCPRTNPPNTLYTTEHGTFCAEHFTHERHDTRCVDERGANVTPEPIHENA